MNALLLEVINEIRANKGLPNLENISDTMHLRHDIKMDSLDLAELSVRIESKTSVDIFAAGIVSTVGEVLNRLNS